MKKFILKHVSELLWNSVVSRTEEVFPSASGKSLFGLSEAQGPAQANRDGLQKDCKVSRVQIDKW